MRTTLNQSGSCTIFSPAPCETWLPSTFYDNENELIKTNGKRCEIINKILDSPTLKVLKADDKSALSFPYSPASSSGGDETIKINSHRTKAALSVENLLIINQTKGNFKVQPPNNSTIHSTNCITKDYVNRNWAWMRFANSRHVGFSPISPPFLTSLPKITFEGVHTFMTIKKRCQARGCGDNLIHHNETP